MIDSRLTRAAAAAAAAATRRHRRHRRRAGPGRCATVACTHAQDVATSLHVMAATPRRRPTTHTSAPAPHCLPYDSLLG